MNKSKDFRINLLQWKQELVAKNGEPISLSDQLEKIENLISEISNSESTSATATTSPTATTSATATTSPTATTSTTNSDYDSGDEVHHQYLGKNMECCCNKSQWAVSHQKNNKCNWQKKRRACPPSYYHIKQGDHHDGCNNGCNNGCDNGCNNWGGNNGCGWRKRRACPPKNGQN